MNGNCVNYLHSVECLKTSELPGDVARERRTGVKGLEQTKRHRWEPGVTADCEKQFGRWLEDVGFLSRG